MPLFSVEICAGAGGQALGLEQAGWEHNAVVEIDRWACATLRRNRPRWNVVESDVRGWDGRPFKGIDLLAGGVPCPPFSHAGKQLGAADERNLFPEALRLVDECRPRALLLENVRGLLDRVFEDERKKILVQLAKMGYTAEWRLLNAANHGVPQSRPRALLVGVHKKVKGGFEWPTDSSSAPPTVGDTLYDLMAARHWSGANAWREGAQSIAPTLVGGSKKHGGADLGPTRARAAWAALGVDGKGLANEAPEPDFQGMPRLTTRMAARIQGFPDEWAFEGGKTAVYRQIGNAFPPAVAKAVGQALRLALTA